MRRTLWLACAAALLAPVVAARADVMEAYSRVAQRHLSPSPLVFTKSPRTIGAVDKAVSISSSRRRSGYALRLVGRNAVIALIGGDFKTTRAALRDLRSRTRSMRVRGRRGFLVTSHGGRILVWSEGGRVYELASDTPRKVSLRQLKAAANGLDSLGSYYIGGAEDPNNSSEGEVLTTAHTVSVRSEFESTCTSPSFAGTELRDGQANAALMRRSGNSFSFSVPSPWSGTVQGSVGPSSAMLQIHATGTLAGENCDTGQLTLTLPRQ